MVYFVTTAEAYPLKEPFNLAVNVTAAHIPNIGPTGNSSTPANSLLSNTTTNVRNGTNNQLMSWFTNFNYFIGVTSTIINFITGGFIWSAFAIVGMPTAFVFVLQGMVALLLVRTVLYYVLGR